ncbi:MAG TPA: TRZ/ATZ family hydrolase [Gammaproteobacteria bacterium]|nr:TRZ/ATZ family hydrolase [Gammaproteobacteria bacterium]
MSGNASNCDTLVHARWVVPVEPAGTILEHHSLAIADGRILAVLPTARARREFRPATEVPLPGHALIPGLVNAHTHAAMSLMRGLADDMPLGRWLQEHIWPAESRWIGPELIADGTDLAIAEMLAGGTTCFNDMYFFPDVVARRVERAGIRACVGLIMLDLPTAWGSGPDEYLAKGLALQDEYKHHPLVTTAFAPHAPYTVSDGPLTRLRTYADELDRRVHIHLHETADEVRESVAAHGMRPLDRLERLGLLTPNLVAVHVTQLEDAEIERLAAAGAHVVHCPESNLKLASGMCRAADLDRAGVDLALGTDGAASNNDLDMIGEMRTAALLAKAVAGDAAALPAPRVLRMATLGGARALGLEAECGSLEPGKWADLAAVRLDTPDCQPVYNAVSQIVYAATRQHVTDVWVAGRQLYRDGSLIHMDVEEVAARARTWGERIARGEES